MKHSRTIADQIRKGDRPQGDELRLWDVGQVIDLGSGFGLVQGQDVGKKCWVKDYGFAMENNQQRDIRKGTGTEDERYGKALGCYG